MLFGGDTLKDFAFALIIGVASGTYSSVFIASARADPLEEREPVYKAREVRIAAAHGGHVPAYAGVEADIAPTHQRESRRASLTTPQDPSQGVSREEFDDLVANLGVEPAPAVAPRAPRPCRRAPRARHRAPIQLRRTKPGGSAVRRRRSRSVGAEEEAAQPPSREAALMAMLVWVMVGLAIWHFTIFLPDHFWGGIVGAFLGACFGAAIFGLADQRLHRPGTDDVSTCSRPSSRSRARGWDRSGLLRGPAAREARRIPRRLTGR